MNQSSLRVLRRSLLATAILATAVATFVTVENWRGDRAWSHCEATLVARGFDRHAPDGIPPEQNLFVAPVIKRLLDRAHPNHAGADPSISPAIDKLWRSSARALIQQPFDPVRARQSLIDDHLIPAATTTNPAEELRAALKPADAFLDDVCATVAARPNAAWPTDDPLMTRFDFTRFRRVVQLLAFRANVELAMNDRENAFRDVSTVLALANRVLEARCTMVSVLIAAVTDRVALDVIQNGSRQQRWTVEQLAHMQDQLTRLRPIARLQEFVPAAERLAVLRGLDGRSTGALVRVVPWWLFHGWLQQNKVVLSAYGDATERAVDPTADALDPAGLAALRDMERNAQASHSPYRYLMRGANLSEALPKIARTRDKIVAGIVGIAVERFQLKNHRYPTNVDELVPEFLPTVPRSALSTELAKLRPGNNAAVEVILGDAIYVAQSWPPGSPSQNAAILDTPTAPNGKSDGSAY